MLLESRPLWFAQTNTWVIAREAGGPALIIDAPPDLGGIVELLNRHDLAPVATILTHGHVDHMGGAFDIERRYPVLTYVHPDDDFLTLDPAAQIRMLFGVMVPGAWEAPVLRTALVDGLTLDLGGVVVEVRHTPGHTPGHCCFFVREEGWLFSGDQLFAGSIGRTDLPGGDLPTLASSMRSQVMSLDDEVRVLPGHGPETTIGRERRTNPFRDLWAS